MPLWAVLGRWFMASQLFCWEAVLSRVPFLWSWLWDFSWPQPHCNCPPPQRMTAASCPHQRHSVPGLQWVEMDSHMSPKAQALEPLYGAMASPFMTALISETSCLLTPKRIHVPSLCPGKLTVRAAHGFRCPAPKHQTPAFPSDTFLSVFVLTGGRLTS